MAGGGATVKKEVGRTPCGRGVWVRDNALQAGLASRVPLVPSAHPTGHLRSAHGCAALSVLLRRAARQACRTVTHRKTGWLSWSLLGRRFTSSPCTPTPTCWRCIGSLRSVIRCCLFFTQKTAYEVFT